MKIVTVVPTLSRHDLIRNFERSYTETAPPEEPAVFVVMGADDGTAGFLRERTARKKGARRPYQMIMPLEPLHFAAAVNAGVTHALAAYPEADTVVLANNDLILRPGWYEGLGEMMSAGVEIAGAKLLYPRQSEIIAGKFDYAHLDEPNDPNRPLADQPRLIQHFGKWFSLDFYPFHVLRGEPETHEKAQEPMVCPDVTFALVGIRRDVWERLGGLDVAYVNGFEDDDFCLRARELGAEIGVHPGFKAIHLESQTSGQDTGNKMAQWRRFQESWIDPPCRIQWPLGVFAGWRN